MSNYYDNEQYSHNYERRDYPQMTRYSVRCTRCGCDMYEDEPFYREWEVCEECYDEMMNGEEQTMENFNILLHIEDLTNYGSTNIMDILQQNEEVYYGMDSLAQYGKAVGFNSTEFYAACEEAFVNASYDVAAALSSIGIYETNDFISFIVGFAYAKKIF